MIAPVVHMNGSNGQELLDNVLKAAKAVETAFEAVVKTCPHGRDYYLSASVHPGGAIGHAMDEYMVRKTRLQAIYKDLTGIAEIIQEQLDAKAAQRL